jgi:hypothetical protein
MRNVVSINKDSVPRHMFLNRTWFVDSKFIVVDPLPQGWDDDYSTADKERWLRTTGTLVEHEFKEHVSIDDGTWDYDYWQVGDSLDVS